MTTGNPASDKEMIAEIHDRGIAEIVHFTTNSGLTGILASRSLKARALLEKDHYLEKVLKANAADRKDTAWLSYVNLSISRINRSYFNASVRWHIGDDLWWCILAFDPLILAHQEVHFSTTNNIYTGVKRKKGINGLQSMFSERVHQFLGNYAYRVPKMEENLTTCEQAEVLYHREVATEFLRTVYVARDEDAASAEGVIAANDHRPIPVVVASEMFG